MNQAQPLSVHPWPLCRCNVLPSWRKYKFPFLCCCQQPCMWWLPCLHSLHLLPCLLDFCGCGVSIQFYDMFPSVGQTVCRYGSQHWEHMVRTPSLCRLGLSVISHPSFLDNDPKDTHSLTLSVFFCGGNGPQRMSKQINKSSVLCSAEYVVSVQ